MRRNLAASAAVLVALSGEWLGHGLAYFRVAGAAGMRAGLTGGVHGYMVPLGAALLLVAAIGGAFWVRVWLLLGRRLDTTARAIRRALRGGADPAPPAPFHAAAWPAWSSRHGGAASATLPSALAQLLALAAPIALLQVVLYLVQENVEQLAAGASVSLAPLLAGHAAATLILAAVAVVMAALLGAGLRLLGRRWVRLAALQHLITAIRRRRHRLSAVAARSLGCLRGACLLLGSALWDRPPPATIAA